MAYSERSLDDYVDVATRIADFREAYPDGTLQPASPAEPFRLVQAQGTDKGGELTQQTFIVYTAAAYRWPSDERPGIGVAWEIFPGRTPYTRGSELQNAETSAWGRAIIAVGASDSKRGIASREEVRNRRAERDDGLPVNQDGSLSRSRTSDAEKDAAGVMTKAQMAEHTALQAKRSDQARPAERLAATPADDPFYDSPGPAGQPGKDTGERAGLAGRDSVSLSDVAGPGDRDDQTPGSITRDQSRAMHAAFRQLGITDREKRLEITAGILGRAVASSSGLSRHEAGRLLTELAERARA